MEYKKFFKIREEFQNHAQVLTDAWISTEKPVKARFPRGYIRTYDTIRPRWSFLDDAHKTLLCQMMQLCDVNRWNLNIWDLAGTAGAAYVWHSTIPVIAVMEVLCREFLKNKSIKPQEEKFYSYIKTLKSHKMISEELSNELDRLRKYRNNVHLDATKTPTISGNGLPEEWNKACNTLYQLEESLNHHN